MSFWKDRKSSVQRRFSSYSESINADWIPISLLDWNEVLFQKRTVFEQNFTPIYEVEMNIVAEDYVREFYTKIWGMDQYCQRGGATTSSQKKRTFYQDRLSGISFSETKRIYINLYCVFKSFSSPLRFSQTFVQSVNIPNHHCYFGLKILWTKFGKQPSPLPRLFT